MNDIHTSLKHSNIKLFADDTNCFFSGNNFHSLQETVITEVCLLQNWVNANELTITFDPDKSCCTVFKPTNKKLPDSYKDGLIPHNNVLQYRDILLISWQSLRQLYFLYLICPLFYVTPTASCFFKNFHLSHKTPL